MIRRQMRLFVAKWWPGISTPLWQGRTGRILWIAVDDLTGIRERDRSA
jgi:hypothetical protein